jgi:SpoVK/Ycf46/Vps4 family AAA+-type ATPase
MFLTENTKVSFDNIAGLQQVKDLIYDNVIYPSIYPDLYVGLREPIKGVLLFGPPGTGKTVIVKAISTELENRPIIAVSSS